MKNTFKQVLWMKQNFPDNYTSKTFPDFVQFNRNPKFRSFNSMIYGSLWILDHISLVILFYNIFLSLTIKSIHINSLFFIDFLLLLMDIILPIVIISKY